VASGGIDVSDWSGANDLGSGGSINDWSGANDLDTNGNVAWENAQELTGEGAISTFGNASHLNAAGEVQWENAGDLDSSGNIGTGAVGSGLSGGGGTALSVDWSSANDLDAGGDVSSDVITNTELDNSDSFTMNGLTVTGSGLSATFENDVQVQGDLDVWGNVSNTQVNNLEVDGDIIPPKSQTGNFDLGNSTHQWRNLDIANNADIDGDLTVSGTSVTLPSSSISNAELANSAITINTGSSLDIGGSSSESVSLGSGSSNLNVDWSDANDLGTGGDINNFGDASDLSSSGDISSFDNANDLDGSGNIADFGDANDLDTNGNVAWENAQELTGEGAISTFSNASDLDAAGDISSFDNANDLDGSGNVQWSNANDLGAGGDINDFGDANELDSNGNLNPSSNLDMGGNDIRNDGSWWWGMMSLETGDYKLSNGTTGSVTKPGEQTTNCDGGIACLKQFGSNQWAIEFNAGSLLPMDEGNFPGEYTCWGTSAGDNEIDDADWGEGVRSTMTDSNGHCIGTSGSDSCAATFVYESSSNSHDTYGIACKRMD
jgi:hypothetical protein